MIGEAEAINTNKYTAKSVANDEGRIEHREGSP